MAKRRVIFNYLPRRLFTMEANNKVMIVALGNPLLDISVNDEDASLLKKYNLTQGNAILAGEEHKALYTDLWANPSHQTSAGGSAMNTIRCANFMMKGKYPGSCAYLGCIADDATGQQMEKDTKEEGLTGYFAKTTEANTGACAVLVQNKERSLVADLGACLKYPTEHLKQTLGFLESAKVFYVASFFISSNFEALIQYADFANTKGKKFAYNLSATFLIDMHQNEMKQIFNYVDILFGNEDETAHFGKVHGIEGGNKEIATWLAKYEKKNKDKRIVVTTQGKEPTLVTIYDHAADKLETLEFPVDLLENDKIVDLNSAGDAFAGGFLTEIALGKSVEDAVKAGQWCSKMIIQ
jgi:adenosine kinase